MMCAVCLKKMGGSRSGPAAELYISYITVYCPRRRSAASSSAMLLSHGSR